jgi:hypothetical protein
MSICQAPVSAATAQECADLLKRGNLDAGVDCYVDMRKSATLPADPIMNIWRVGMKTQEQYQRALDLIKARQQTDDSALVKATAELLVCRAIEEDADGDRDAAERDYSEAAVTDPEYNVQRYVISYYWRKRKPERIVQLITAALKGEREVHNRVALLTDLALAHYWLAEPEKATIVLDAAQSEMWALPATAACEDPATARIY